LQKELE
jgi:predicted  nucleic acid-binding Zn-ribbon protein